MVAKKPTQSRVTPRAPRQTVTPISAWKKQDAEGALLLVPSGKSCKVRNPGLQVFVKRGMIPNSLMPLIQEALKGEGAPELKVEDLVNNQEIVSDMMSFTDAVVIYCMMDPQVESNIDIDGETLLEEQRDPSLLYVDELDMEDKSFILQYAMGGTRDLEKFRLGS